MRQAYNNQRTAQEFRRPWHGRPTVAYDATCGLCRRLARLLRPLAAQRGVVFAPVQRTDIAMALGLKPGEVPEEFKFLRMGQRVVGGGEAVLVVAQVLGWWPVAWCAALPGGRRALAAGYRFVAAHRHCNGHACARHHHPRAEHMSRDVARSAIWMLAFTRALMATATTEAPVMRLRGPG